MDAENFEFTPESFKGPSAPELQGPPPAGFNERFIAFAVDASLFIAGAYYTLPMALKDLAPEQAAAKAFKLKLLWTAGFLIYQTLFSSGGRATLGKYLLGIRVKARDGVNDISVPAAFIRSLGYLASSLLLNIGYLMALFTSESRALHDCIAGSRVISVSERGDLANGFLLAVSWALMAGLTGAWVNQNLLRPGPEERAQVAAARTTVGKLAVLEEIHKSKYGGYTDDLKRLAFLTRNVPAVRREIEKNIEPDTLAIASDGRAYVISAKARNWRHTEVRRDSIPK